MSKRAAVFPGQGSQRPGMGKEAFETPAGRTVFDAVSEAIGKDVAALCFDSDEETLRRTENAQIALFTASVASYQSSPQPGVVVMAGHSVGEYAALACAGVLSVTDGAKLVARRGELMAEAGRTRPGAMAAVLGLDAETVSRSLPSDGVVVVANDNCPGQVVISGEAEAVKQAAEALKTAGAKRCLPLNVSGAFHSPLMAHAAEKMRDAVATVDFSAGALPVVSNVTAQPESDWPELLVRQLVSPVRWTESVQTMLATGAEEFVEFGPGDVLTGLLKRIAPEASGWNFDSRETKD